MSIKNIPEPEIAFLKTTFIMDGNAIEIQSDPEEFVSCEELSCARDLFEVYVSPSTRIEISEVVPKDIVTVRGGKVFVYRYREKEVYLVVHRADLDPRALVSLLRS